MIGKFLISFYIANSNIQNVYGTAGSFVILMVWVYYSSVILYFGAEFAKRYAIEFEKPIVPYDYAEEVKTVEVTIKPTANQSSETIFVNCNKISN